MSSNKCYFVCATHRSGSSLLCELLSSTGIAGRPDEYFQGNGEVCWYRDLVAESYGDFISKVIDHATTDNGVTGVKFMVHGLMKQFVPKVMGDLSLCPGFTEPRDVLNVLFPGLKLLFITRRDKARQAWSWSKARQTGVWRSSDARPDPLPEVVFNPDEIDNLVLQLDAEEKIWNNFFAYWGEPFHQVVYEELAEDPVGETRRALDFLGVNYMPVNVDSLQLRKQSSGRDDDLMETYKREKAQAPTSAVCSAD